MIPDLTAKLSPEERVRADTAQESISPDDGKYRSAAKNLRLIISPRAEWMAFVEVQRALLATRIEFGQAEARHLEELDAAIGKVDPLNMEKLEADPAIHHDQLAVIAELSRYLSPETEALLHPGTTSYDVVDTARAFLFKRAWYDELRPEIARAISKLCSLSERSVDVIQVGRTHLQNTSPVTFGLYLSVYAARLAERLSRCDADFSNLRGKVSGIVGTGASIDMVIGEGKSLEFETAVLAKLGLTPTYAATQITPKEAIADVCHDLVTLDLVLANFANDMRLLYSSAIKEVTSRDNAERLGGSSADAMKDNPIDWENIAGKADVIQSSMSVAYAMMMSDLQRDLRNSVQGRYQPQGIIAEVLESFIRANKALGQLSLNEDRLEDNLLPVRKYPSEAMVAILRGTGFIHSTYGVGHAFVNEMGKRAAKQKRPLLEVALEDAEFSEAFRELPDNKQRILRGDLELYLGSAAARTQLNVDYARKIIGSLP